MIKVERYYPPIVDEPDEPEVAMVETFNDALEISWVEHWRGFTGFVEFTRRPGNWLTFDRDLIVAVTNDRMFVIAFLTEMP